MTLGGRLVSLFPVLHGLLFVGSLIGFILYRDLTCFLQIFVSLYVFPVLIFRLHNLFWPLKEGVFDITAPVYNVWWASYQFQFLFISFPFLETPWHFIPGGFSFWLRLWGSKVGKNVLWTPRVEVLDRGLLEVGSNVVVGHIAAFVSHVIGPKNGRVMLMVKKITLGDGSFIGAASQLGPGALVAAGEMVKAKSVLYWKGAFQ